MVDHSLGLAIDHRLVKLLPHQLANQMQAPPRGGFLLLLLSVQGISRRFQRVVPLPRAGSYALLTCPPLETPLPV